MPGAMTPEMVDRLVAVAVKAYREVRRADIAFDAERVANVLCQALDEQGLTLVDQRALAETVQALP